MDIAATPAAASIASTATAVPASPRRSAAFAASMVMHLAALSAVAAQLPSPAGAPASAMSVRLMAQEQSAQSAPRPTVPMPTKPAATRIAAATAPLAETTARPLVVATETAATSRELEAPAALQIGSESRVAKAAPAVAPPRFDADYLHNPKPLYPSMSRRLGEEGTVSLRVRVAADGTASEVALSQSSGFPHLDAAAREAVQRWRFVPARRGDEAIESWVGVPVVFAL